MKNLLSMSLGTTRSSVRESAEAHNGLFKFYGAFRSDCPVFSVCLVTARAQGEVFKRETFVIKESRTVYHGL